MRSSSLHFKDTGYFSKIILDYLEGDKKLAPFFQYEPKIESFAEVIQNRTFADSKRETLVSSLERQYKASNIPLKKNVELNHNLDLLKNSKTYTITTGHQLSLFTGPLYFIYKIVSVIKLTEQLKEKYPEFNFVPVYWMATEDHDFEEISHFTVKGNKITWKTDQKGAVGRMNSNGLEEVYADFEKLFADYSTHGEELKFLFSEAYLKQSSLANATRYIVHKLFGSEGLVIIDGDDISLKSEFKEVVREELLSEISSQEVEKQSVKLAKHYKIQVNPREINLFYMKDDIRERIIKQGENYLVNNTKISFSSTEILEELDNHPDRFSPNVLLRPLYQETILPNLAYIGGGGELAYWFQLKSTFEHFSTPLPVLLLRNSALWINKKQEKSFDELQIGLEDLFKEKGVLLKDWIVNNTKVDLKLTLEVEKFKDRYEELENMAGAIDSSLQPYVAALSVHNEKQLNKLSEKLIRAERKKQKIVQEKVEFLKHSLFPNNGLQERTENFTELYLVAGKEMISLLKENFHLPTNQFNVLSK